MSRVNESVALLLSIGYGLIFPLALAILNESGHFRGMHKIGTQK